MKTRLSNTDLVTLVSIAEALENIEAQTVNTLCRIALDHSRKALEAIVESQRTKDPAMQDLVQNEKQRAEQQVPWKKPLKTRPARPAAAVNANASRIAKKNASAPAAAASAQTATA